MKIWLVFQNPVTYGGTHVCVYDTVIKTMLYLVKYYILPLFTFFSHTTSILTFPMFSVISHVVFENPILAKMSRYTFIFSFHKIAYDFTFTRMPIVLVRLLGLPLIIHIAKHIVTSV